VPFRADAPTRRKAIVHDLQSEPAGSRAGRRRAHVSLAPSRPLPYRPITDADDFRWPNGARLAVYLGFNIEHFAFGEGLGANLGPVSPSPTC
jgi:hypothetical protein